MKVQRLASAELSVDEHESGNDQVTALAAGDQVMVSVTHQIQINGSDAWVKYAAASVVRPGESVASADSRVIKHVTSQVIKVAEEAAAEVINREGR
jgi:hypothetical protein